MAYVGTPIDTQNQFQSLQGKRFSGDASTTAFTLDIAPSSVFDIEVFVENVRQDPNSAYSLNGTTLTFTGAPPSGTNNIYVVHQAKAVGTISPAAGTVNADSFDNTVISGHTALAAIPATTDELLISDAGTIKRIDAQFFQNTPAFSAQVTDGATVSIASQTVTKVTFATEIYDSDSKYDTSTSRFTPGVSGKYFVYARLSFNSDSDFDDIRLHIHKNGTRNNSMLTRNEYYTQIYIYDVLDLNTTDYVEIYAYQGTGGSLNILTNEDGRRACFGAYRIIGA
jgi:hypothetical protein